MTLLHKAYLSGVRPPGTTGPSCGLSYEAQCMVGNGRFQSIHQSISQSTVAAEPAESFSDVTW